jgi:hypothetical protein
MIVAANQPYFAPFPAFFVKAALADVFVILDTVQFPRGTSWVSRNRFKGPRGPLRVTVPVWRKGLGLQRIREVRICHEGGWAAKLLETFRHAYGNAPWYREQLAVWEEALEARFERLLDLNLTLIRHLRDALGLRARLVLLSDLEIDASGQDLLVALCRRLGADTYLAQDAARSYLQPDRFLDAGLGLRFYRPPSPVYPQLWGAFVGNLSAFDLVWCCGPKSGEILRRFTPPVR